jgi:hypothetical protein
VDPTIGIVYVGDDEDPTTDGTIVIKLFQSVQKCATGLVQLAQTTGPLRQRGRPDAQHGSAARLARPGAD